MEEYLNEPTYEQYPHTILNIEFIKNNFIHVITPAKIKTNNHNPLIVFITNDEDNLHLAPLINVASQGFTIGIIPNKQLKGNINNKIANIKSAIRYMILNAYQFSIDINRYFIWGEQSGAELALTCITTAKEQQWSLEDVRVMPLHFRGGIIFGLESLVELSIQIPKYKLPEIAFFSGIDDFTFSRNENLKLVEKFTNSGNKIKNYLLKNTVDGTDAFYTPYVLTLIEQFIKKLL